MIRRNLCTPTLLLALLVATLALISHQSRAELVTISDSSHYVWVAPTAIADGRARVIITKTKAKLHLPKIYRPVVRLAVNDNEDDYYDETPEFQVGYRRPELIKTATIDDNIDLTDEIKLRLLIARCKAVEKYKEVWG